MKRVLIFIALFFVPITVHAQQKVVITYPGPLVSGLTVAMTATTSTSVITATVSNFIYVTQCVTSNTHASVSTEMVLQDGSGGTSIYTIPAPFGGGSVLNFTVPLKVPTAGNALFVANLTTGSSTKISCSGFKSPISY